MSLDPQHLFLAAVELPALERMAFLDTACGQDLELRRQVDSLLEAHEPSACDADTPTLIQQREVSQDRTDIVDDVLNLPLTNSARISHTDEVIKRFESGHGITPFQNVKETSGTPADVIAGRYTLIELLGEGGMGEVWIAQQSQPVKRRVALKLIKGGMDSRGVIARFEGERQALARMDHPNIARVLDGGLTENRRPFFVMELVDGQPLAKFCDEARLTIRERLEIFILICEAVQHAHQKGLIHRDLKPGNILVSALDGRYVPKVIDFGLAKATEGKLTDDTMATVTGSVVGTLEYMSPEQAGAVVGGDIDTRSDIYSLGVILYELLTGLRPFDARQLKQAGPAGAIRIIQQDEPAKPSSRLSNDASQVELAKVRKTEPQKLLSLLQGELDWVVMKCLEKSPERRYETANALARDIERYLAHEPVEARPPSTRYRLEKFLQRNKGPVIAAGFILLALIGGIIGTGIGLVRAWKAEAVARTEAKNADDARRNESLRADGENQANLEAQKQRGIAEENAKEAKRQLADGLIAQGDALKLASRGIDAYERYREAYQTFQALNEAPKIAEVALWEHAEQYVRPLMTTVRHGASSNSLAIAQDNRTGVMVSQESTLVIWDIVTGRELRTLKGHNGWVTCIALSPDGQRALSGSNDKTLKVWDLTSGQEIRTLVGHAGRVNCVALSPDGLTAVSGGDDRTIMEWDLSNGKVVRSFQEQAGEVTSVALSPDGRNLFAATRFFARDTQKPQGKFQQWDMTTGQILRTFGSQTQLIDPVAFSADGLLAVAGMPDQTMLLWDLNTGEELRKLAGHTALITNLVFSPDGRSVLSGSSDGALKLWDLSTGKEQCSYLGHTQRVWSLGISPDGRFALSGSTDGILKLWDLAPHQQRRILHGHAAPVRSIAIPSDGRTALSGSWDNTIRHWDLESGKDLSSFPQRTGGSSAAISSDGTRALFANDDFSLNLWDLVNGVSLRRLAGHTKPLTQILFSPDGRTALSASLDQTLKYWDLESGSERYTLKGVHPQVSGIAISPDGRTAVSAGFYENSLKIWDLSSGEARRSLFGHSMGEWSVSISGEGTFLSSGGDGTLKLWSLDDGKELRTLTGHQDQVWGVAISHDGRLAFSGSFDSTLKMWDLTRGKELRTLLANKENVASIAITADGRLALSGSMQGSLLLWDFFRASRTMELEDRLEETLRNLQRDPSDAAALTTLGTWYSFRGMNSWGMELLVRARELGAEIPTETLARCYWKLGQFTEAKREFEIALKQSQDLTQQRNLVQFLRSIERESEHYRRRDVAAAAPPLTDDDVKRISELPPNDQIAEIQRELENRNPNYRGQLTPTIVDDIIIGLVIHQTDLTDLSPIHALTQLKSLEIKQPISNESRNQSATNLTPLRGLPLIQLDLSGTNVSDLSPLQGMPLQELNLSGSKVTDLTPLQGMPLKRLNLLGSAVADLSPLAGMPLESLNVDQTDVRSLAPLRGMPLKSLTVVQTQIMAVLELEALQCQQKGDLEGVVAVWHNAVENCAIQDMRAYENLSHALRRNRDLKGSIRVLEKCLKTVPNDVVPYEPKDPRPWGLREKSVDARNELLNAYATDGRWEDAIRIGMQWIEQSPEISWNWYRVAVLLAINGDDAGHRAHCLRMIEQFEKSSDINIIWATCTACVLLPNRDERTRFAEQKLTSALDEKRLDADFLWISVFSRPLLALRLNDPTSGLRYNEAALRPDLSPNVKKAEVAEGARNISSPHQIECNRVLYLAYRSLARRQLGQAQEARADALEAAELNEHLVQDDDDSLYERLMARILIREATVK